MWKFFEESKPHTKLDMVLSNLCLLVVTLYSVSDAATLYDELSALNATTVLSLIDQAGLATQLKTGGPFTLLVPTDTAFSKIPTNDLAAVTSNAQSLLNVLNYHMLTGVHNKTEFMFGRHYFLNSTNGHTVRVYRSTSGLHFNQATAIKTDVNGTNGVIYLINTVLDVPEGTVTDILQNKDYNTSKFYDLVKKANLADSYAKPASLNRYSVFAPSNTAFDSFSQAKMDALSKDYTNLRMLVEYHVHAGTLHAASLAKLHSIRTTLPNHRLNITASAAGVITLNGIADIVLPDIEGENGVVHVISNVLMPDILNPFIVG